jgi:hypothetical protein
MRGDKQEEIEGQKIIIRKNLLTWGTIVDNEGVVKGHIISTKWHMIMVVSFFVVLILIAVLSALVLINRVQMDNMQNQINVEQGHENDRNR